MQRTLLSALNTNFEFKMQMGWNLLSFQLGKEDLWSRESFTSVFANYWVLTQWQSEYIIVVLEMARGTSPQLQLTCSSWLAEWRAGSTPTPSLLTSQHMHWKRTKVFRLKQGGPLALFRSAQLWKSSKPDFIKLGWVECWEKPERFWNLRWWTPEQQGQDQSWVYWLWQSEF